MKWFPPVTSYMHFKWTESMTMNVLYVSSTTYEPVSTGDVIYVLQVDISSDYKGISYVCGHRDNARVLISISHPW